MPCFSPIQGFFEFKNNKKKFCSCEACYECFKQGRSSVDHGHSRKCVPCGRCVGCRIMRSQEWAVRCVHEASLYENNCFITLTYDNEHLPKDLSLDKRTMQLFMKKLRKRYGNGIRVYYCGEYGDLNARPHYHAILFNHDFDDRKLWKIENKQRLYISESLAELWGHGICSVGDVTFKSAAYVARYILKKINGEPAEAHYNGRLPEFTNMSRRPGIARDWWNSFKGEVFPSDYVVIDGKKYKPPRYYSNQFQIERPEDFESLKALRMENMLKKADDNTYERLLVKQECFKTRLKRLKRTIEV